MANKNYYKVLGVDEKASKDDIKKAFRKLAHKYHPDKSGGDESKFKEVNEAYQILSDDKKRSEYDMYGNIFSGAGGGQPGGGQGFGGFDFSGFNQAGGVEFDFGDIFGDIFSGGAGGGRGRVKRGRDISVDIQISFAESVFGVGRKILINKVGTCEDCQGSGAEEGSAMEKCTTCGGKGKINETRRSFLGQFTTVRECQTCHGKGEVPKTKCKTCLGEGVHKKSEEISISIPAGIENGEMIRMTGKGEAVPGGMPGDLYIKIHVEPHKVFKREGSKLLMDLNIKITDALLGKSFDIETLEGKTITVKVPAGVNFGEILRVKEKGVPMGGGKRGDLLIRVVINTPKKLSRHAKKLIEDLKKEGV